MSPECFVSCETGVHPGCERRVAILGHRQMTRRCDITGWQTDAILPMCNSECCFSLCVPRARDVGLWMNPGIHRHWRCVRGLFPGVWKPWVSILFRVYMYNDTPVSKRTKKLYLRITGFAREGLVNGGQFRELMNRNSESAVAWRWMPMQFLCLGFLHAWKKKKRRHLRHGQLKIAKYN